MSDELVYRDGLGCRPQRVLYQLELLRNVDLLGVRDTTIQYCLNLRRSVGAWSEPVGSALKLFRDRPSSIRQQAVTRLARLPRFSDR